MSDRAENGTEPGLVSDAVRDLEKQLRAEGARRWLRRGVIVALLVGAFVGFSAYRRATRPPPPARYTSEKVEQRDIIEQVQSTGSVKPLTEVQVGAQVSGRIVKVHVDFNKHGPYQLDRRLNLLLYLNKDWKEEYGGHLQLWDKEMKNCEQKILPIFNRVALFSTTETSWHGHPDPLTCPEGWSRKSLALYYYTNGRADGADAPEHTTVFRERPGEVVKEKAGIGLRDFVPPIVWRGVKKLVGKG